MRRSGFKTPAKEKLAELNEKKRQKNLEKLKEKKTRKSPNLAREGKPRRKKTDRKKAEEALWQECRRITLERWGTTCYTCGAQNLEGRNWQCGHGKPKGAIPLRFKYDLRNLRPQCFHDNMQLGGLSDIYIAKLAKEEEGLQFLQESCYLDENNAWRVKGGDTMGGKDATIFIQNLLAEYKNITYKL